MQVNLYKKTGTYEKDGENKYFTRFYVKCGGSMIPVEPTYFRKKDEDGEEIRDLGYSARKSVLEAFADDLPEKEPVDNKEKTTQKKSNSHSNQTIEVSEADMPF